MVENLEDNIQRDMRAVSIKIPQLTNASAKKYAKNMYNKFNSTGYRNQNGILRFCIERKLFFRCFT